MFPRYYDKIKILSSMRNKNAFVGATQASNFNQKPAQLSGTQPGGISGKL